MLSEYFGTNRINRGNAERLNNLINFRVYGKRKSKMNKTNFINRTYSTEPLRNKILQYFELTESRIFTPFGRYKRIWKDCFSPGSEAIFNTKPIEMLLSKTLRENQSYHSMRDLMTQNKTQMIWMGSLDSLSYTIKPLTPYIRRIKRMKTEERARLKYKSKEKATTKEKPYKTVDISGLLKKREQKHRKVFATLKIYPWHIQKYRDLSDLIK